MIACVIGSRTFTDRGRLFADLDRLLADHPDLEVISGGAKGADQLAQQWADSRDVPFREFLPDYERYGRQRGAAEAIRNREMVKALDPSRDSVAPTMVAPPGAPMD